jgi:subtilisin
MVSTTHRRPSFEVAAIRHTKSSHVVASMISRVGLRAICLVASLGLMVGGAFAATGDSVRKIVVFQEETASQVQQQVVQQSGSQVLNVLSLVNGIAIALPPQGTTQALAVLQANPTVVGVYDDSAISGQDGGGDNVIVITPADPPAQELYPWGLGAIHIPEVHYEEPGLKGSGVGVAILDTGIDLTHPDLSKNVKGGYNALAGQDPKYYQDDNGHGTHMAGIIAARSNGLGVIGAAYQAKLYAVKVLDQYGSGRLSDLINGLGWVQANKIRVVNMSLGFSEGSSLLEQAIQHLYEAGVIMVASAGNRSTNCAQDGGGDDGGGDGSAQDGGGDDGGGDTGCDASPGGVSYPARYPGVIAVAATDSHNMVTDYSRSGPEVAIAAPGGSTQDQRILSTNKGGGYGWGSGTSQAAAHVTGALALALQVKSHMSFEEAVTLLQGTAKNLGEPVEQQGAGLIDVEAMMKALKQ